jgi:hypothetical protein
MGEGAAAAVVEAAVHGHDEEKRQVEIPGIVAHKLFQEEEEAEEAEETAVAAID